MLFLLHTHLSKAGKSIMLWLLARAIYKQRVGPVNEHYIILKYALANLKELIGF